MKKPLTIKDIAELANVSITTVSRVLNKNNWVSDKTRARVEKVIEEQHFSPNLLARGMISKKTQTLAIIVSDISNPYFVTLVTQIEHESLQAGYKVTLYDTQSANKSLASQKVISEENIFNSIMDSQIDGVIILGGNIDYNSVPEEYLNGLKKLCATIPVVVVGRPLPEVNYSCILRDQAGCVETITQHLISKGYQRIGFIGGSKNVYITRERINAFRLTMKAAKLSVEDKWIIENNFYYEHGYQSAEALFNADKILPQALVCINDHVAKGVIRALKDRQINVPDDIAVASCEYFPGSEYYIPRITTVNHQNELIGKKVMEQLMGLLASEAPETPPTKIPLRLMAGESC